MTSTTKRTFLVWAVTSLGILAVALMAIPLIQSFSPNSKVHSDNPIHDVAAIKPGELRKFESGAWVYRRTAEDLSLLGTYDEYLADPNSEKSLQPDNAKNKWRSAKSDFFVFLPPAPGRYCSVTLVPAKSRDYSGFAEAEAVTPLNHFFEPCDGRTFDASGRVFYRKGWPEERNLTVPGVDWLSETRFVFEPS